uniref:Ubinuclein-1 n=1 Tax=Schistosoma haematobium TaxID=6185 RepID=A0A095CFX7_SCHHA
MVTMKNSGKHKRVRIDDFLDPGDGYDTQDSFIDDSEAVGELLDKAVKRLSTPNAFKPKLFLSEPRTQMRNLDSLFDEVLYTSTASEQDSNAKGIESCKDPNDRNDSSVVTAKSSCDMGKPKVLPENLPPDIVACLNNLTELNKHGTNQRRTLGKPFDTELLKLDIKLKELMINQSVRSDVFSYLESHLQLKHKAVMRRLKRLKEDKQEQRMNPLLDALGEGM